MALKAFKKTSNDDTVVMKLQENIDNALAPVLNSAIIDGILLQDVVLATGLTNKISHKLNRKPLGYIVIAKNANAQVWDSQATNLLPKSTLELLCSADVTVSLWVF